MSRTKKETTFAPIPRELLIKRGYCCGMKCQNCPYYPPHRKGSTIILNMAASPSTKEKRNTQKAWKKSGV